MHLRGGDDGPLELLVARGAGVVHDDAPVAEVAGGAGPGVHAHVAHRPADHHLLDPVPVKSILDRHGVDEVVICGAMSHMCVDAGTRAASDLGYRCVVVHDACATHDQKFADRLVPAADVHAAFMAALGFGYAKLVSTEEYLAGKVLQ